jgi:hypothetical protein
VQLGVDGALLGEQCLEAGRFASPLSIRNLALELAQTVPQPSPTQRPERVGEGRCTRRIF